MGKPSTSLPNSRQRCSRRSSGQGPDIRLYCPAELPGVSLTLARSSCASLPRHAHDSLILGVVLTGVRRLETGGVSTRVPRGAVFALAPGQAHACAPAQSDAQSDASPHGTADAQLNAAIDAKTDAKTDARTDAATHSCSYLALSIAPGALPPELAGWRAASPRVDDPALAQALVRLAEALDAPTGRLERQSLLAECLELLAGHGLASPGRAAEESTPVGADTVAEVAEVPEMAKVSKMVGKARQLIGNNLEGGVDLAGLAAACGVDMFALHRAFTRELGLPPHSYQTRLRLRRAKELLRYGTSLAEAALASGFCDQAHMTRHFARVVGLSPAHYARAHANSARPGASSGDKPDGRPGGENGNA